MVLIEGTRKRIYVHQQNIKKNQQLGTDLPVMTVWDEGHVHVCSQVRINGPSELVYRPDAPHHEARVWVETTSRVEIG